MQIEGVVSLFRAIGENEFFSVMRTGRFSYWSYSAKVKYFANDFDETLKFANMAFATDITAILEIRVHTEVLDKIGDFTNVDTTLFKSGTVEIQPEYLEEFNDSILEIIHRF
jgi:filamentous hemagglutinin